MPTQLNELAAQKPSALGALTVDQALSDRVGLATTMGNLGGSAELLYVSSFADLRQARARSLMPRQRKPRAGAQLSTPETKFVVTRLRE